MATMAPSAARRLAIAAPIPLEPPVTSATLPSSFFDIAVPLSISRERWRERCYTQKAEQQRQILSPPRNPESNATRRSKAVSKVDALGAKPPRHRPDRATTANCIWLEPRSSLRPPDQVRGKQSRGTKGVPATPGSPRRFAPRDDDFINRQPALTPIRIVLVLLLQ